MISCLGIITKNRSETLNACLKTYLSNIKKNQHKCQVVIVGDIDILQIQESLKSYVKSRNIDIRIIGRVEKRGFQNLLTKHNIPKSVVKFALMGHPQLDIDTGANRNNLLLYACGERYVSVDDDTQCICLRPPHFNLHLTFANRRDPTSFWFPNSFSDFPGFETDRDFDFLAEHDQILGKKVTELKVNQISPTNTNKSLHLPNFLQNSQNIDPRIRITFNGLYGDSGCEFPTYLLFLTGASLRNLLRNPKTYFNAKTSRQVFRASLSYSISDASVCMSTFIGLDGTVVLPPFMPSLRAQDGLFGEVVSYSLGQNSFCHLPFALKHQPPMARHHGVEAIYKDAFLFRVNDILRFWVSEYSPSSNNKNSSESLRNLGSHFLKIGSLSTTEFSTLVTTTVHRQLEKLVKQLHEIPESLIFSVAEFEQDKKRLSDTIEKRLKQKWYPQDIAFNLKKETSIELLKSLTKKYGELLYWWPDIFELSKDLKRKGEQIAQII